MCCEKASVLKQYLGVKYTFCTLAATLTSLETFTAYFNDHTACEKQRDTGFYEMLDMCRTFIQHHNNRIPALSVLATGC